jgi:hypothetical protein
MEKKSTGNLLEMISSLIRLFFFAIEEGIGKLKLL